MIRKRTAYPLIPNTAFFIIVFSIFFQPLFSNIDYSIVEAEFSRFFSSQRVKKLSQTPEADCIFSSKKSLQSLIEYFSKNQNERPIDKDKAEFSLQACRDMAWICGDEGREDNSFLLKLERPVTEPGTIFLAGLLANPLHCPKKLKRRADLIKVLRDNQNLSRKLSDCLSKSKRPIKTLISMANSDYQKDSECLLNGFFGLYWKTRSLMSFIPKKLAKLKSKDKSKKLGQIDEKENWRDFIDNNDLLSSMSFFGVSLILIIDWCVKIASLAKNSSETFNFLKPIEGIFDTNTSSAVDAANSATLLASLAIKEPLSIKQSESWPMAIKQLESHLINKPVEKSQEPFSIKNIHKYLFTSLYRAEICDDAKTIWQNKSNPIIWVTVGPKFCKRLIKPIYLIATPILIFASLKRQMRLYKIALKRARREILDMQRLIILFEQILKIFDEHIAQNPDDKISFEELDLYFHIKNLIENFRNDDFGRLIEGLKTGAGKMPGRFLRIYKQLYLSIDRFRHALEALGQIDAFLAISKLSSKPEFCFANYIEDSVYPIICANNFWDPLIGNQKTITNSIKIGPQQRGIIITGSNASGKSTLMRAVFRCAMTAQSITLVPAENFCLTPFKETFTLMSKRDDPPNRSQYRVEADQISQFLKKAEKEEFIISVIDEMFNTTGAHDCQALTRAIIEHVAQKTKAITMISTHNPMVTKAEKDSQYIFKNYKITAKRGELGQFLGYSHKIMPGIAGKSDSTALDVALLSGIDLKIVNRARQIKEKNEVF